MKHFGTEAKWMLAIPVAVFVVGLLVAMFAPYFL